MSKSDTGFQERMEEVKRVKNRVEDRLLQIPGVNAVGIAPKVVGGQRTGELAITVFLTKKKPLHELSPEEVVPHEIEGIKTDVEEKGPIQILAERPIIGGMPIGVSDVPGGTLGCILTPASGGDSPAYLLTNQHVFFRDNDLGPLGGETGPVVCSMCSPCCSDMIGHVSKAKLTPFVDAAIAQLNPGVEWLAEVRDIGAITGSRIIASNEIMDGNGNLIYAVKKYGDQTHETTGKVATFHLSVNIKENNKVHRAAKDQIYIESDPFEPFAKKGDSGAVILNSNREVVGLLCAADERSGDGIACPIGGVLTAFKLDGFDLQVSTASGAGQVRVVPGGASAMIAQPEVEAPVVVGGMGIETADHRRRLIQAQEEILGTAGGQRYAEVMLRHQQEVRALIDTNKRVATAWHRNYGPTILHQITHAVCAPETEPPSVINGRSLRECVEKILSMFRRYGSPSLISDIDLLGGDIAQLVGLSYNQCLSRLRFESL